MSADNPAAKGEESKASPTPGTPEHDAAMAAKYDQVQAKAKEKTSPDGTPPADGAAPAADPNRPAWLPEKFKSPEDMAKAYAELEKKQGAAPKADDKKPAEGVKPNADLKIDDTTKSVGNVLEQAGFKYEDIQAEYNANGKLTDATYKGLTDKFGAGLVDDFIRGQEARATQFRSDVLGEVGGQDGFNTIATWAAANLSKPEIEAFNSTMDGGNLGQIKLALAGLNARYTSANGKEPKLAHGDVPNNSGGESYASRAEYQRDVANPLYKKDSAFRAKVMSKLSRSTTF